MPVKEEGVERKDILRITPEALKRISLRLNLRQGLEGIEELAADIATKGQIQPGVVRRNAQKALELVAGYRRFAAIQFINANPEKFPELKGPLPFLALIRDLTEEQAVEVMLSENMARRNLSAMDQAFAAQSLSRLEWKRESIATALHTSPVRVGRLISFLALPKSVRTALHEGRLNESAAHALLGLEDEAIEETAERLMKKEIKASDLVSKKRSEARKNKPLAWTMKDFTLALSGIDTAPACDLLSILKGELPDPNGSKLRAILAE